MLHIREGACGGPELSCDDDACENSVGGYVASRITPSVTAGQRYTIVVDGYDGASGDFTLTVIPP